VKNVSAVSLAEGIQHLLENPALRQSMGQIGADRFRKWVDWGRSVEQLEQAYRAALS
jgi:glycosyltransferase involved in cell wall biosynthesis